MLTVAGASPSTGAPAPVAAAPAGSVPAAGSQAGIAGDPSASAQTVLLPTGDRVIVDAPSGSAPAIGLPDPASLGDAWTIRAGWRVYVFPASSGRLVWSAVRCTSVTPCGKASGASSDARSSATVTT